MARLEILVLATIFLFISWSGVVMGADYVPPCASIINQLSPCVSYLTRQENQPETACCNGVKYLKDYTSDKQERQSICECLESVAPMYGGLDFSLIRLLPKKCRVSMKIPNIDSPNFDCSKA
ncbi:hypothetical protein EZV62_025111 [Acer yangbiense]|uniref:Non-specific lipid-transfer protein n=1 Tax=Acer yangbiense TaxID=1000413 RepID=A0A5C7GYZ3_9ROSI|nr:hypothetical protein EZV62_025111 [Acer yangbiense]